MASPGAAHLVQKDLGSTAGSREGGGASEIWESGTGGQFIQITDSESGSTGWLVCFFVTLWSLNDHWMITETWLQLRVHRGPLTSDLTQIHIIAGFFRWSVFVGQLGQLTHFCSSTQSTQRCHQLHGLVEAMDHRNQWFSPLYRNLHSETREFLGMWLMTPEGKSHEIPLNHH